MGYLAVVLVCANPLLLTTADANYVNLLTATRRNREGHPIHRHMHVLSRLQLHFPAEHNCTASLSLPGLFHDMRLSLCKIPSPLREEKALTVTDGTWPVKRHRLALWDSRSRPAP